MGRVKDSEFWQSATMNNATFMQYYMRLTELSISMFEWKNLPDTIDARFLELVLFGDGQALFFKDEEIGALALRCTLGGRMNVYDVPNIRRAYAANGYNAEFDQTNSVVCWNNMLRRNSRLDVEMFAKRLYNLDRIVDVNANAQKTPVLVVCDETQRLTMQNVYQQYDGNKPVIFGDKNINPNSLKTLSTEAPYVADKIYELKIQYWNEALTYLGISNINTQKKERMITDEVTRNMGSVVASRYSRLEARKQACREFNRMFGYNIDCKYREDLQMINAEDLVDDIDDREVVNNEQIYYRDQIHL